ncbi:MAG: MFS transporter [Dehalococcoidia bacterium]
MQRPFYGWLIVGVAAVTAFSHVSFFNPVLGVFVQPLSEEFGWSRATIAAAITIGSVGGAIASPLIGPLLDRGASRLVIAAGGALMGVCLLAVAFTPSVWWFYLFYSVGRATAVGITSLGVTVVISNWFVRNRGVALGITLLGSRAAMALLPLSAQLIILAVSWRAAFGMLGVMVLCLAVLPSLRFLRHRPEDMGLLPDGLPDRASAGDTDEPAQDDLEEEWTLREAARTPALWLLTLATSQIFLVGGAVNLHQMPHLVDQGLSSTVAVGVISTFAVFGGIGGVLSGLIQRRLGARWTLAASLVGTASGLVVLINADNVGLAYFYGVWYGLAFGSMVTMMMVVYAEYFGRRSLGSIRGAVAPIQMAFNAVGPLLAGWAFDVSGSYLEVFWAYAGLLLLSAFWMVLAPRPRRGGLATG